MFSLVLCPFRQVHVCGLEHLPTALSNVRPTIWSVPRKAESCKDSWPREYKRTAVSSSALCVADRPQHGLKTDVRRQPDLLNFYDSRAAVIVEVSNFLRVDFHHPEKELA